MTIAGQRRVEPVVYPSTDHMGEHEIQRYLSEVLRPLLAQLFRQRGVVAHAGADTFIYWREGDPKTTVAPDVYVLPGIVHERKEPSWKLWELGGVRPSFALEIVGGHKHKDYEESPALYADMGCAELVIFDPYASPRSRKRARWQHYKRDARGAFRKVAVRAEDRVRVHALDAWLRAVDDPREGITLRVGLGDLGNELLPTADEAREAESAARVAADEARRAAEENARAAAEENARLRAEIAALRKSTKQPAGR